jgi:hypothetical protein
VVQDGVMVGVNTTTVMMIVWYFRRRKRTGTNDRMDG